MIEKLLKSANHTHHLIRDISESQFCAAIGYARNTVDIRGTIAWVGAGGCQALAQHAASELVGKLFYQRQPISSVALGSNPSLTTALANDFSAKEMYAREARTLRSKDILFLLSTSGESDCLIQCIESTAAFTIAIAPENSTLCAEADYAIELFGNHKCTTIQNAQLILIHEICQHVEEYVIEDTQHTLTTECLARLNQAKQDGKKIVFTNGCFNILHAGHIDYLRQSAKLGDILVVAVNTDTYLKSKGWINTHIVPFDKRCNTLRALGFIDFILPLIDNTPLKLIKAIQPNIITKGPDWARKDVVGYKEVKQWNGKVHIVTDIAYKDYSSSTLQGI